MAAELYEFYKSTVVPALKEQNQYKNIHHIPKVDKVVVNSCVNAQAADTKQALEDVKTELEAKFSIPFLLSAIVLRRRVGMREFTDDFVASAPVQQMMRRVTGVFDPAIEARGYDKIRSIVEVDLVDGRTLVEPADERYRGGPDKPFTRDELHGKFRDCAELVMSADQISGALAAIESVETMADVRQLVRALAPAMA